MSTAPNREADPEVKGGAQSVASSQGPGARGKRLELALVSELLSVWGLAIVTLALFGLFSLLLPSTFPTLLTFRAIALGEAPVALLALGETLCIASGNYDLSVGYAAGLISVMIVMLNVQEHVSWPVACLLALAAGLLIGLTNGVLVHYLQIDSFIATLGSGTLLYGLGQWYTNGADVPGYFPHSFTKITGATIGGVPITAVYVLVAAVLLWAGLKYLPMGRYIYAWGDNREATALAGIRVSRIVITVFVVSGICAALAGILLASQLQTAESDTGVSLLLPAFVAPMLGAAAIKVGHVNIWGTMIAILLLSIGIAGIEQLGGSFWTEAVFDGGALIIAVGVSGFAVRRRAVNTRKRMNQLTEDDALK
jgi:ribose transport system permease protein